MRITQALWRRVGALLVVGAVGGLSAGCAAIQPVNPWEKSTLALDTMKPAGPVPAWSRIDAHVYYSKEAVRGGAGVGGGGCGCN
jgi:hypothetical protein